MYLSPTLAQLRQNEKTGMAAAERLIIKSIRIISTVAEKRKYAEFRNGLVDGYWIDYAGNNPNLASNSERQGHFYI
jgi:hypothetical protein